MWRNGEQEERERKRTQKSRTNHIHSQIVLHNKCTYCIADIVALDKILQSLHGLFVCWLTLPNQSFLFWVLFPSGCLLWFLLMVENLAGQRNDGMFFMFHTNYFENKYQITVKQLFAWNLIHRFEWIWYFC